MWVAMLTALALTPSAAAKPRDGVPSWVALREQQAVAKIFGRAQPVAIFHILYARKIAVVFEFQEIVVCKTCSAPTNQGRPRGRVVRLSFDRRTHLLTGSMRFCEVHGITPPLSACLTR